MADKSGAHTTSPVPYHVQDFELTAATAFAGYPANVREGGFIDAFAQYVERELERHRLRNFSMPVGPFGRDRMEFSVRRGRYALGGYYEKELDVGYYVSDGGPLAGVSLKSMMSSVGQNVNNRWEETVGDAANLHGRFPMLVLGYFMVVPYMSTRKAGKGKRRRDIPEPIIDPTTNEPTELARRLERRLRSITGRQEPTSLPGEFEEVALCVVDFSSPAPVLHDRFPSPGSRLRLDDFFDRLRDRFRERNPGVPL